VVFWVLGVLPENSLLCITDHHQFFACLFLFFFLKLNFYLKEKLVQVCFEMFVDRFFMIGRLRVSFGGCENLEL
jgi:hypothetical protein